MPTKHHNPPIEAIPEDSDGESRGGSRSSDRRSNASLNQQPLPAPSSTMSPTKGGGRNEKEKVRRKSATSASRHSSKTKSKNSGLKRVEVSSRDSGSGSHRIRHRRIVSTKSLGSSSSSDSDEPVQDHKAVLAAARARLTSPSTISAFSSLTTTTNTSSGSSGSNSTVTQASITKQTILVKQPQELPAELPENPLSPHVPDPPDVFAFLEEGGDEAENDADAYDEEHDEADTSLAWPTVQFDPVYTMSALPSHLVRGKARVSSSSASGSFRGSDAFSEPAHSGDNDTDRSTSPEHSVKDHASDHETDSPPEELSDSASLKFASQMAAAQERQNRHSVTAHRFGTPDMQRGAAVLPHLIESPLSYQHQQQVKQRALPRAEKLPVTGYELLAKRLSQYSGSDTGSSTGYLRDANIKPLYRKFAGLNHRLLLHLQDEISELEEQLHRLDNADTQSRRAGSSGLVVPASRRQAAMQGGELEWHKTDVLGRIAYKLAQYNQALASFNSTQSLAPPSESDISTYRQYLRSEHPIVESETHFLKPADDLISVCSSIPPSHASFSRATPSSSSVSLPSSVPCQRVQKRDHLPGLAAAVAVAVLVPILTFAVIPGFLGRVTVVGLVSGGVVGALAQSGAVESGVIVEREGMVCAGIYGGAMFVLAGIL